MHFSCLFPYRCSSCLNFEGHLHLLEPYQSSFEQLQLVNFLIPLHFFIFHIQAGPAFVKQSRVTSLNTTTSLPRSTPTWISVRFRLCPLPRRRHS